MVMLYNKQAVFTTLILTVLVLLSLTPLISSSFGYDNPYLPNIESEIQLSVTTSENNCTCTNESYVPYTGATKSVDLGSNNISSNYGFFSAVYGGEIYTTVLGATPFDTLIYLDSNDFYPETNGVVNLGAGINAFKNLYLSNNIYLYTMSIRSGSITDTTGRIDFDNENLSTIGNITANKFIGDGSLLTGISTGSGMNYINLALTNQSNNFTGDQYFNGGNLTYNSTSTMGIKINNDCMYIGDLSVTNVAVC